MLHNNIERERDVYTYTYYIIFYIYYPQVLYWYIFYWQFEHNLQWNCWTVDSMMVIYDAKYDNLQKNKSKKIFSVDFVEQTPHQMNKIYNPEIGEC